MSLSSALRKVAARGTLSAAEARDAFLDIMEGRATAAQKGALLLGLASRGETAEELAGAVGAVREKMRRVPASRRPLLDTCGTGGHGRATVNVSTAAAFVCAGAGVAVAKHGNRSATRCGSADVLEELGVRIEKSPEEAAAELDRTGFTFLFAPAFHPAMREVGPTRRELAVRTIFNLIGPLANPAGATRQLIGVGGFDGARLLAEALAMLGTERAIVFHSENGIDELTPGAAAVGFEVRPGRASAWRFDPGVLAQKPVELAELAGGGPADNAAVLRASLGGAPGPVRETVLLNSAAALWIAEAAPTLHEGYAMAEASIDSGRAADVLARASAGEPA
ncbi:MAG TPA: anthranilate phosphoribosyltransferase [Thermoanaerobaculia bacterium]|nr:anthranilate phosphoribosyltransferase [Thermoanaerobaculia bacterium]